MTSSISINVFELQKRQKKAKENLMSIIIPDIRNTIENIKPKALFIMFYRMQSIGQLFVIIKFTTKAENNTLFFTTCLPSERKNFQSRVLPLN